MTTSQPTVRGVSTNPTTWHRMNFRRLVCRSGSCSVILSLAVHVAELHPQGANVTPRWALRQEWISRSDSHFEVSAVGVVAGLPREDGSLIALFPVDHVVASLGDDGNLNRIGQSWNLQQVSFERFSGIGSIGDTVWIADGATQRFTLFLGKWRPLFRSFSDVLPVGWASNSGVGPRPVALLAGGTVLAKLPVARGQPAAEVPERTAIALVDSHRSTSFLDTIEVRQGYTRIVRADQTATQLASPFGCSEFEAHDPGGKMIVVVKMNDRCAEHGRLAVKGWRSDGTLSFSRTMEYVGRPVTPRDRDEYVAQMKDVARGAVRIVRGVVSQEQIAAHDSIVSIERPTAEYFPPVARVLVASDLSVWLLRSTGRDGQLWSVLGPNGRDLASVKLYGSPHQTVLAVDASHVWVVSQLSGPSSPIVVVRYRIDRSSRSPDGR
jgi:hypothetical protein